MAHRAPDFSFDLQSLIWPLSMDEFLTAHWDKQAYVSHRAAASLRPIIEALGSLDLPQLVEQASCAWLIKGGAARLSTSTQEALRSHEAGETVQMRFDGEFARFAAEVGQALPIMDATISLGIYASRTSGLPPHWDQNDNFTIQLAGVKEWQISSDSVVEGALKEGYMDMSACYLHELPKPPYKWRPVVMKPGSMLYIPRGHWHATRTLEPSISLNFLVTPRPWVDVVLTQLRAYLLDFPEWRASVTREPAALCRQWARLADEVDYFTKTQAFRPPIRGVTASVELETVMRRSMHARWSAFEGDDPDTAHIQVGTTGGQDALRVSVEYLPLLRWLATQRRPFSVRDVLQAHERISDEDITAFLHPLVESGFLEPLAPNDAHTRHRIARTKRRGQR